MPFIHENAILHQSGVSFFRIFTAYRKEKKIRTEKIVSGVLDLRSNVGGYEEVKNRIGSDKSAGIFGY